jgi:hypothetical protein
MRSIGSSLFKPQTVLFALEPRRGTRLNPPQAGSSTASVRASKRTVLQKKDEREAFRASLIYGRFLAAMMGVRHLAES